MPDEGQPGFVRFSLTPLPGHQMQRGPSPCALSVALSGSLAVAMAGLECVRQIRIKHIYSRYMVDTNLSHGVMMADGDTTRRG